MKKEVSSPSERKIKRFTREETTISICSSSCKMFIRLPLEFNLFGKLKKPHKKLLFNMLKKNVGLICYNMKDLFSFDCCIKDENIMDFINTINKKFYTIDFEYFIEHNVKIHEDFFVYREQKTKKWFIAFNVETLISRYCDHKLVNERKKMNFIPFKSKIYNVLDPTKKKEAKLIDSMELVNLSSEPAVYYNMSNINNFDKEWKKDHRHGIYKFYALESYDRRDQSLNIDPFTQIKPGMRNPNLSKGIILVYSYLQKINYNKQKHEIKHKNTNKKTTYKRNNHSRRR